MPQPGDLGDPRWHHVDLLPSGPNIAATRGPGRSSLARRIAAQDADRLSRNQGTWAILVGTTVPAGRGQGRGAATRGPGRSSLARSHTTFVGTPAWAATRGPGRSSLARASHAVARHSMDAATRGPGRSSLARQRLPVVAGPGCRNQGTWAILVGTCPLPPTSRRSARRSPQPGDLGDPRWHFSVAARSQATDRRNQGTWAILVGTRSGLAPKPPPSPQPGDLGDPRWHCTFVTGSVNADGRNQGTWAILVGTASMPPLLPPCRAATRGPGRSSLAPIHRMNLIQPH